MTSRAGWDLLKHVKKRLFGMFALSWTVEIVILLWEWVGMDEVCLRMQILCCLPQLLIVIRV